MSIAFLTSMHAERVTVITCLIVANILNIVNVNIFHRSVILCKHIYRGAKSFGIFHSDARGCMRDDLLHYSLRG